MNQPWYKSGLKESHFLSLPAGRYSTAIAPSAEQNPHDSDGIRCGCPQPGGARQRSQRTSHNGKVHALPEIAAELFTARETQKARTEVWWTLKFW